MGKFSYEALDKGGKAIRGVVQSTGEDAVIEQIRNLGMYPTKVAPHHDFDAKSFDLLALPGLRTVFHRVKRGHVVTFSRQLATLIGAGLPIIRSLQVLTEQVESVVFRDIIRRMIHDLEAGHSLSETMAKHETVFDKLYLNMVRAGEIGGVLEDILNKIADYLEKRQALVGKVKSALIYPMVVLVLAALIVTFILWKIVPRFVIIFEQLGAELPGMTLTLMYASNLLVDKTWIVIISLITLFLVYRKINSNRSGKYLIDRMKLKLPIFGKVIQKLAIARFSSTLAAMVNAGVPILQALDIVRDTSGNEVVARAVDRVYDRVREGESIHEPLLESPVFSPMVIHMIAVGEETGAMDEMLQKIAEAYEREVDNTVSALTSIIEPLILVFLGGVIGYIVVALYLPLFNLIKVIN